jgi:hypothetical protein
MALMNFPRSFRDTMPDPLILDKPNLGSSASTSLVHPVALYKYLSIVVNLKLCWTLHQTKALTTTSFWSPCIWHLSRSSSGISMSGIKRLYNTVAIPSSDVKVQFSLVLPHIFPNPELDFRVQSRPPLELQT